MDIRKIDASLFTNGFPKDQKKFSEDLLDGLKKHGAVKLVNHPIPDDVMNQVFEWNKRFFELSDQQKKNCAHPPRPNPHRGYSSVGQEKTSAISDFEKGVEKDDHVFDVKESFDQGARDDGLFPNIWPAEEDLPGFRAFMEDFFDRCQETHLLLLKALASALELPVSMFEELLSVNTSELRILHYPEVDVKQLKTGTTTRISPHTDFGTLTLLFQDSVGGLEVEDQKQPGRYVPVESHSTSEMIVQVGDSLQRWTNGILCSASHRVTIPADMQDQASGRLAARHSVAYFGKPNREVSLKPFPEFVGPKGVPKYEDITTLEYMQKKLCRTYAY